MAGKSSKGAMRLLTLRGLTWWMKIDIPKACRHHFKGRTAYLENLQTSDVRLAKERRDEAEREIRNLFTDIKSGKVASDGAVAARERGLLWREAIREVQDVDAVDAHGWSPEDDARYAAEADHDRLRGRERQEFGDALVGRVPVEEHLEPYLTAIKLAPKTTNERRGLVMRFARWCQQHEHKLDGINRRIVGQYVGEAIQPMDRSTAKKHLTALRGYWDFLTRRGYVEGRMVGGKSVDSPWEGQEVTNNKRRVERGDEDDEREFTEEELRTLLYSPYPAAMDDAFREQIADALRMSLLSGMRMAEVLTLWAEEVHDGVFDIKQGKTRSAARKVPIHPDLTEIVARRTTGKGPKDMLFHELTRQRDPGDTFGKRFNRYRRHLGVDDVRPGKRRSLVNFHSARRWFTTEARHAGQPVETIKDVIGHAPDKKKDPVYAYARRASGDQMRECVQAVSLPPR